MSSLTHPHVVPNISLLHWNTKQNKLKNVFAFAIKVSGVQNTIVWTKKKPRHFSKYLLLWFAEEKSCWLKKD